ncbi:MAG TPA: amino acid permease, partial [Prolixibacteraceae bacterium]|nr:amino acid permease [Prolixibacteraceae bacterium]
MSRTVYTLPRKLGFFPLFSIVVANMVGAGIFTTTGLLMENLGDVWVMLLLWLAGGVVALCGALSYSELAAAMPQAGGEYVFLSRLFHPLAGFLSGWVSFIAGFSAPIAASAIGFSEYFLRAFPQLFSGFLAEGSVKKLLALAVILLFTAIHLRGISFGARVQNFLTVMKITLMVGLIGAGLWFGAGNWSHFAASGELAAGLPGWKAGGLALMWIMFAYSGWNAATYIGSEVKSPRRNIPRALIAGTL